MESNHANPILHRGCIRHRHSLPDVWRALPKLETHSKSDRSAVANALRRDVARRQTTYRASAATQIARPRFNRPLGAAESQDRLVIAFRAVIAAEFTRAESFWRTRPPAPVVRCESRWRLSRDGRARSR